ncbi:MAG TPA: ATP-binding protein [Tepidisphaeraceae bacterium]|nr:ATP-binding protein [Tepidisphaeraceae bacterium]
MIAESSQLLSELRPATVLSRLAAPQPETARRMEELARIILAYSEVTEKLQQSHEQLRSTVESLRQQLSEKNRLLERKNRLAALGEMAAGLAHEIRNPLGGIQLYASMLAQDVADRDGALKTVHKIAAGVKRLDALVGQVLQFTREVVVNPQPIDLHATVSQAVEYAQKTFDDRGIGCRIDDSGPLSATVDPLLLGQVVLNLILNAAEAMECGGTVTVEIRPPVSGLDAKQFQLIVRDTGPGIPSDVLDRIFNPFFTTKDSGTGLGLSIVHRIIEAHDGTITVSNQQGGGARFEIRV